MFNLVTLKGASYTVVCAVFDKKNNELWSTTTYSDIAFAKLNELRYPIDVVIHDDYTSLIVFQELSIKPDKTVLHKPLNTPSVVEEGDYDWVVDYVPLDHVKLLEPIANESLTGVGFARLINRSYLKQNLNDVYTIGEIELIQKMPVIKEDFQDEHEYYPFYYHYCLKDF